MKTIVANIPERKTTWVNALKQKQTNIYPARTETFLQDDEGRWSSANKGALFEAEVIDVCKDATNWADIKSIHFPMYGFHS